MNFKGSSNLWLLWKKWIYFLFFKLWIICGFKYCIYHVQHSVFQAKTNIDLELQTYKSRLVQEETAHKEAVKQLESQMHLAREESNLHQIKGETEFISNQLFHVEHQSRTSCSFYNRIRLQIDCKIQSRFVCLRSESREKTPSILWMPFKSARKNYFFIYFLLPWANNLPIQRSPRKTSRSEMFPTFGDPPRLILSACL